MAKDAKGHGSDARGVSDAAKLQVVKNTDKPGTTHALMQNGQVIARLHTEGSPAWRGENGESTVHAIAAAHGIPTSHLGVGGRVDQMSDAERRLNAQRDSEYERDEANRDFSLRARNGQIGSGMKFRG